MFHRPQPLTLAWTWCPFSPRQAVTLEPATVPLEVKTAFVCRCSVTIHQVIISASHARWERAASIWRIPAHSLLLEKATATVAHTGGQRFEVDHAHYEIIRDWLAAGALPPPAETPTVSSVEMSPSELVLGGNETMHRMVVTAVLSDGQTRDVSDLAVFRSSDPAVATVDDHGLVCTKSRGETFVTCRFDVHTVGSQVLVLPAEDDYQPPEVAGNYIDSLVAAKLEKLRYRPAALASDAEFLRRTTIDLNGRLPTVAELETLLNDESADRRQRATEDLLSRPEFDDVWTAYWADILLVRESRQVEKKPAYLYHAWLRERIQNNVPLDEIVRELLTASGSTFTTPATNFFAAERDRQKVAENVAQAFLGIRLQCAKCHNHPFDRWTMDDYYGFAAFFHRIARKKAEDYREWIIFGRGGEIRHPVTQANVAPKFLGGAAPQIDGQDRRQVVADWITSPDNPYFAKNVANRLWAHFFGRGLVDPVDDVRVSNPPSNPALYEELARRLVASNFNLRQLARDIVQSEAYQRSTHHTEDAPIQNDFGRAGYRRIPATVLLDCVSQVTEHFGPMPGVALGEPAIKAPINSNNFFLKSFGTSGRTTVCACESKTEPTLSQGAAPPQRRDDQRQDSRWKSRHPLVGSRQQRRGSHRRAVHEMPVALTYR